MAAYDSPVCCNYVISYLISNNITIDVSTFVFVYVNITKVLFY